MSRDIPIVSTIPPEISTEAVLEKLHDHEFVARLSPTVVGFEPTDLADKSILESEPEYKQWYRISEHVPLIGRTSFLGAFKNQPDGFDSIFLAPAGLVMHLSTRVVVQAAGDGVDGETRLLSESNHLAGNRLLMPFIAWQFARVHRQNHIRLFDRIRAG